MKDAIIKQLSLYNYRYAIGYTLYAVLLVLLLVLYINDVPHGLSTAEMNSAARSATANVSQILTENPINAPYVLLQKASMSIFGITPFAIKLPSLVLGFATGMILVFMLRQWFRDNVAVLTGIIVATAGPFLSMGRLGTPMILYAFWLSLILLAATKKLYGKEKTLKWKLIFFMACALSLYTPMMIYPLLAIGIAGLVHPHVRYAIRQISTLRLVLMVLISLVLLAPLVLSIVKHPNHTGTLLGILDSAPSWQTISKNATFLLSAFFDFINVSVGTIIHPLFNAATMIVVALGLMKTITQWYSARSYMLLIWTGLIIPVILINPDAISVLYIPIVLFLAIGIETLIREWYKLFPRNPYARIAALVPLTILLVSISTSNIARYFYGYSYATNPSSFSSELTDIRNTLDKPVLKDKPVTLVTTDDSRAFYDLLRRDYKNLTVVASSSTAQNQIVTESQYAAMNPSQQETYPTPYRLVTTRYKDDSLSLRVYVSR